MVIFTKGTKQFNRIKWVLTAICKDKARLNLCVIHVDTESIVTTDGKRVHRIDRAVNDIDIEPGDYKVLSNTAHQVLLEPSTDGLRYPDYHMVIPRDREMKPLGCYGRRRANKRPDHLRAAGYALTEMLRKSEPFAIDINFLADALQNQADTDFDKYSVKDGASPILLESPLGLQAVIMPVRL